MQGSMQLSGQSRRNWNTGIRATVKWGYAGKILAESPREVVP